MKRSALAFVGLCLLRRGSPAGAQQPSPIPPAAPTQHGAALPDAPNPAAAAQELSSASQRAPCAVTRTGETYTPPRTPTTEAQATETVSPSSSAAANPCPHENVYRRFLDDAAPAPLTPRQKALLAGHNIVDPFNLLTIVGNSAIYIGANAHTAYGPGWRGFGDNVGVSLLQDATGEVVGTFMLCSLFHQDPHYHRMPHASPPRRVLHAIGHTVMAPSDTGKMMPNMENFLGYPINAEISNLYVPGIASNAPSTAARVLTGLATDPIGNLITEFLPDVAKHLHIRVVFVQRIINQVATGTEEPGP